MCSNFVIWVILFCDKLGSKVRPHHALAGITVQGMGFLTDSGQYVDP